MDSKYYKDDSGKRSGNKETANSSHESKQVTFSKNDQCPFTTQAFDLTASSKQESDSDSIRNQEATKECFIDGTL